MDRSTRARRRASLLVASVVAALTLAAAPVAAQSPAPSLADPEAPGRDVAWSQFSRPWKPDDPTIVGHSLRDATHRYTRWVEREGGRIVAEEVAKALVDRGTIPRLLNGFWCR